MIGYSSNLTIFISPSTVGKYTCHVSVRGYRDVSASSHVYARGPPVIVKSLRHVCITEHSGKLFR